MSEHDHEYILHTAIECERLDRQVPMQGEDTILRHAAPAPGSRMLDAGSGSGAPGRLIARHHPDAQIFGVDMNPAYLAYARRKAAEEGLANLTYCGGELEQLPFPDNTFDLVWSQYVLYFVPDPHAVLTELLRVTRPGGEVVMRLDERTMTLNHPIDDALQAKVEVLIDAILGGWRNVTLPEKFWQAGYTDVRAAVEFDGLYTIAGKATPEQHRNVAEVLQKPLAAYADRLGGPAAAEAFLAEWLAYLDRPDTFTATPAWIVRGRVPGG